MTLDSIRNSCDVFVIGIIIIIVIVTVFVVFVVTFVVVVLGYKWFCYKL